MRAHGTRIAFNISPISPFGVEVDYDLTRPLDDERQASLRDLLYGEKLLVFRDQQLTEADQLRVVGHFGKILSPEEDNREISVDGDLGNGPLAYHSDLMFIEEPYRILSLCALDIDDDSGTSTRFANGVRAAARLPAALRAEVDALTATSAMPLHQSHRDLPYEAPAFLPQKCQPVIIAHPVTAEPILFVTELQTARIEGLPRADSDALLDRLFAALYDPVEVYDHVWRPGDFLLWDNFALQHGRTDQAATKRRRLRRIVGTEKSFFAQHPQFDINDPQMIAWNKGERLMA
jgi:taurine dioxygenase